MLRCRNLKLGIGYTGVFFTVFVVAQLVKFLSYLPADQGTPPTGELKENKSWNEIAYIGVHNCSLICCFFLFHSFLADVSVKKYFEKIGLQDVQRSVYVIVSCVALQFLFYSWQPITCIILWNFDINNSWFLWLMYTILHVYIWSLIYVSNLLLDAPELFGIKQIMYANQDMPPPESYKSPSFLRLTRNVNHSSFLGFSIIFWVYPYMRLDRAIFALLFQLYMIVNWKPNSQDLNYMRHQIAMKNHIVN